MARRVLSVFAGLMVGFLCVALIEAVSSRLYPLPAGVDVSDIEAFRAHVQTLPIMAFVLVLVAHVVGSFAAGFTCVSVSRQMWKTGPIIIGVLLLSAGVTNLVMIPHPVWFALVDILVFIPAALLGGLTASNVVQRRVEAEKGP
jgi:hypothetical protein